MVDKNELKSLADSLQETWDSMDGVINPFLVLAHTAICWHSRERPAPSPPAALAVPAEWSLHDRVEFALRDAGFDYDEASRIAMLAAAARKGES